MDVVDRPLLTDSGLETLLVFHHGIDLPDFAAFPLLDDDRGRHLLVDYYRSHLAIARGYRTAAVLETPTWRASMDWGTRLGYDAGALDRINREAVALLRDVAAEYPDLSTAVSGNLGPRGDGYDPAERLSPAEARDYHRAQITSLAEAGADHVTILTATHTGEAIGVVRAAADVGIPVVVSFTVETDGRLPSGEALLDAIALVDAETDGATLHYGINCAHPDHFAEALAGPGSSRIGLLRANASRQSHAELDASETLDDGDPKEFGASYARLVDTYPSLRVLGGCCGTDQRHVCAIAAACLPLPG